MQHFFKIILAVFLVFITLSSSIHSKPIPPGSGKGDVPANILILLDSSVSMRNPVVGGTGIKGIDWAVELDDGNFIVSEHNRGLFKYLVADEKRDTDFANGTGAFYGTEYCASSFNTFGTNKSWAGDITSDDEVWFGTYGEGGQIIRIDSAGNCTAVINRSGNISRVEESGVVLNSIGTNIAMTRHLEIREIDGEEILFAAGSTFQNGHKGRMYVRNLTTNAEKRCGGNLSGQIGNMLKDSKTTSMTISNDGSYIYFSRQGKLWAFPMTADANNLWCPSNNAHMIVEPSQNRIKGGPGLPVQNTISGVNNFSAIEFSRDEDNVIYTTSIWQHGIQRLQVDPVNFTVSIDVTLGTFGTGNEGSTSGGLAAANVELSEPGRASSQNNVTNNISISADRDSILVGDRNAFVQRFTKTKFTNANKDTAWHSQHFGKVKSKFEGAKDAIEAIVTDSSLTNGANFGFGHWNSGMFDRHGSPQNWWYGGEVYCHHYGDCQYYDGWTGTRATGKSNPCLGDYCIEVGVSPSGAERILDVLEDMGMRWGTDGNSFSQMAKDYFADTSISGLDEPMIDPNLKCQLNYVIVISDGHIRNASLAFDALHELRHGENKDLDSADGLADDVQTLIVGYGGSYDNVNAKPIFDRLARAGSCNNPGTYNQTVNPDTYEGLADKTNCERAIGANTPEDLKTEIESKIRQIIAERLAFSAPSITATLEEGGSVYQAQFSYQQTGEWKGHLFRKTILPTSEIKHSPSYGENWDAGVVMKERGSDARKIWTPLDSSGNNSANYVGNWNNWNENNYNEINTLFEFTGNLVRDLHNSNTTCSFVDGVADGNIDDIKGLINFVRGEDYFDYRGGCGIYADRNWDFCPEGTDINDCEVESSMLSDIYHSQLVEVGVPGANTSFTANNQEAYWRTTNGYASFKRDQQSREKIIYAGSNGGMLHAFRANGGIEEWAFVPPMIASKLPLMINTNYEGAFQISANTYGGGSNAIFGVDGSPVVHDVFIRGLNEDGTAYDINKSWRTLLFIPYGRGGPGFSVLDVTNPMIVAGTTDNDGNVTGSGKGPLHMFSIYNDTYNNEVIRVDHTGEIARIPYTRFRLNIDDSDEAKKATDNYVDAEEVDLAADPTNNTFDRRNEIAGCESNDDVAGGDFREDGTNSCYKDDTYVFDVAMSPEQINADNTVKSGVLTVSERVADKWRPISVLEAKIVNDKLQIKFDTKKIFNAGTGSDTTDTFKIETNCEGAGTTNVKFDYSTLGETWSTPRIFRTPTLGAQDIDDDRYVAVMGGGMGAGNSCLGSGVFVVDLEGGADQNSDSDLAQHDAGKLLTDGPILILDSDPDRSKMGSTTSGTFTKGSPITNSIPANPIVITADKTDANWRGAMVYVNDLEGKITKLNFTSEGTLFDQKPIMNLRSDFKNARLNYFEMDAAIGTTTKNLWLFGGTGDFNRIADTVNSEGKASMDNIVYGVKDPDFPDFGPSSDLVYNKDSFIEDAIDALDKAPIIDGDQSTLCIQTNDSVGAPTCDVGLSDIAWYYKLGEADNQILENTNNKFRKVSASPTIYRGRVYFPVYEPNSELGACHLGNAYVCSYNDECGYLDTEGISPDGDVPQGDCYEVGAGILSKLVVFGGSMFANLAGPKQTEDTLVQILASDVEFRSFKRSWRENF